MRLCRRGWTSCWSTSFHDLHDKPDKLSPGYRAVHLPSILEPFNSIWSKVHTILQLFLVFKHLTDTHSLNHLQCPLTPPYKSFKSFKNIHMQYSFISVTSCKLTSCSPRFDTIFNVCLLLHDKNKTKQNKTKQKKRNIYTAATNEWTELEFFFHSFLVDITRNETVINFFMCQTILEQEPSVIKLHCTLYFRCKLEIWKYREMECNSEWETRFKRDQGEFMDRSNYRPP